MTPTARRRSVLTVHCPARKGSIMGSLRSTLRSRWLLAVLIASPMLIGAIGAAAAHGAPFAGRHQGSYDRVPGRSPRGVPLWTGMFERSTPVLSVTSVFGHPPGAAPTVGVGTNPVGVAVDAAEHTVYIANGNDNTVSVINTAHCSAIDVSGCDQTPRTVAVGAGPLALALDRRTQTLYVSNFNNATGDAVSMIDVATCNAADTSGCAQPPPTVTVGPGPQLLALDPRSDTIYVPDGGGNTVSVIDGASCNASDQAGCGDVSSVTVGSSPSAVAVNPATHTAYIANSNDGTVSVLDTATCDATVRSGCGAAPATVTVGPFPSALVVDRASNTVFVEVAPLGDASLGAVAMIDGASCNATTTAGCGQVPRATPDGSGPIWIAENQRTRTVYAVNEGDDDMSVIDARTCNATESAGCRQVAPALMIGGATSAFVNPGNDGGAGAVAVDPTTDTLYATSQDENNVSVLNGARCDATDTSGCTAFAPTTTVGNGTQGVAADPATNTVYVTNRNDDTASVIDSSACNARHLSGCDRAWPTFKVGDYAQDLRVDVATDTIYVVNANDNTVSVVNGATCNAHDTSGCGQTAATVNVGSVPYAIAIDQLTDTIYVANMGDNTVSVIDGATCNGTNRAGCDQAPPVVTVGNSPNGIAIDQRTDTIYVANNGDNTVSVIDGATCNGTQTVGCGHTPRTVAVGNSPYPIDVDQRTGTVYVGNIGDSTMSLIDGNTCNGQATSGCPQAAPAVPVAQLSFGIAVDQQDGAVYITSIVDNNVARIDGRACTPTHISGCRPEPIPGRMGGFGGAVALDGSSSTAYVPNNDDGTVSMFALERR
jgi:YVTN family beta-propeller protein